MINSIGYYKLSNGVEIPCVGFGTWQTPDGEVAIASVKEAISAGYRHIDTAAIYRNEASVGQAIRESGVPREELFITTKVWNNARGYEETLAAFDESMGKLGLDYLDLYLIHWPNPLEFRDCWEVKNAETWRAMEELYEAGKIRAIGISNFRPHHMDILLKTAKIIPMVNQICIHPGYLLNETISYCKEKGILLEAYSPLGTGKIFEAAEITPIAEKYGKTIAQVCLRWSLQKGFLPLPKSVTTSRIRENLDVFDFELTSEEMDTLSNMQNVCGDHGHPDEKNF
ncbi:MAG: pgoN [Bacillales bacterium]|jgi:diketogulonate reductase-like aldo/keto reductase|nr:pgoN [Bacillales bacterium]